MGEAAKKQTGDTYFAPAELASEEDLARWSVLAAGHPIMTAVLETLGGVVALLNPQRQIVAVNAHLLTLLGAADPNAALGLRLGEALGCSKVREAPSGCGTGRACATCGAAIAIVSCAEQEGPVERECLLTLQRNGKDEAVEFLARARRIAIDKLPFTMILLHDIQDQKRRETLERAFFHDILNTMGSLHSYGELLAQAEGNEREELIREMVGLLDRVVREVHSQRDLVLAERGEYRVHPVEVSTAEALGDVKVAFAHHEVATGRELCFACENTKLTTDRTLLLRVLTNMVKNALEATPSGGSVHVWCTTDAARVTFHVHNPAHIPEDVALRIFQRSFTTKHGAGRGMGTYSMKLFGERCLQGRVNFNTSPESGTVFTLELPRQVN